MALLLKHETIERPHRCHCLCEDCQAQTNHDELKFARSRLNTYRALASEAYLSLSTDDPILASFRLRRELLQVAKDEKYYTVRQTLLLSCLSPVLRSLRMALLQNICIAFVSHILLPPRFRRLCQKHRIPQRRRTMFATGALEYTFDFPC